MSGALRLLFLSIALVLIAATAAVHADGDDKALARRHFDLAVDLVKRGRHREAIEEFEKAYEAARLPKILFNIAQEYRELGTVEGSREKAVDYYKRYLAERPDAPDRDRVIGYIAELEKAIASESHQGSAAPRPVPDAGAASSAPTQATAHPAEETAAPRSRPAPSAAADDAAGSSEIAFTPVTVAVPRVDVTSGGAGALDVNLRAEQLLERALDAQEKAAATSAQKADAWCALADVEERNPYREAARQACDGWRGYDAKMTAARAAMSRDFKTLGGYLDLKRKTRAQKLAAVDAFLAAYGAMSSWQANAATDARRRIEAGKDVRLQMARIAAGCFQMGGDGGPDQLPVHRTCTDAFEVDRTETSQSAWRACVDAGACATPGCAWDPDGHADDPVVCVSWEQARAFCAFGGKRLPTEAEWEAAARGGEGRRYPWGSDEPDCAHANFDRCGRAPRPVGAMPAGATPLGVLDLAGNVWEWVEDWYAADYYAAAPATNPRGPRSGTQRVIRGGAWSSGPALLRASTRYMGPPTNRGPFVGFRCALDAN